VFVVATTQSHQDFPRTYLFTGDQNKLEARNLLDIFKHGLYIEAENYQKRI